MVLDDEGRENEGDLIIAAELTTQEKMAFLVRHSSGYVCAPLTNEIADRLKLPLMAEALKSLPTNSKTVASDADGTPSDRHGTAYTITCDYAHGTTTGISAHDRALTVRKLADSSVNPVDFLRPGHVLPLRARDGGILERRGHTEAGVDLCKLTGLAPVSVICELVREEDGLMARRDDCLKFAKQHNLKAITIDDLANFIKSHKA